MKKRVTHHVYVFSENWSAEPEDTWSDYLKNRFREHFRVPTDDDDDDDDEDDDEDERPSKKSRTP